MSLLFNMLSRFVLAFLPRGKHLLISCLLSPNQTWGRWGGGGAGRGQNLKYEPRGGPRGEGAVLGSARMPSGADRLAAAAGATAHSGLASGKRPGSRVGPGWASARPWPRGCSSARSSSRSTPASTVRSWPWLQAAPAERGAPTPVAGG